MPNASDAPAGTTTIRVDTSAYIGTYPFRAIPHPDPAVLLRVMDREGIAQAWVGDLAGAFHRDPIPSNLALSALLAPYQDRLRAAPIVRPDWPRWRQMVEATAGEGGRVVRCYPQFWSMAPGDGRLAELAAACASHNLTVLLTVRFEDLRQRHPLDVAGDLSAAHVRELARARTGARLVVSAAGREMIEEIHWGLTPDERSRVFFDFSWIWGPPSDELASLFRTMGSDRFVYGTMWPLRLTQGPRANLALLPDELSSSALADPSTW